jgi:deoxyribose-phosphate aldolase
LELEPQILKQLIGEVTEAVLRSRGNDLPTVEIGRSGSFPASKLAGMIDHTLLRPEATRREIEQLCVEAKQHHFASVCVQPAWVALAARILRDSDITVGTVAGFPFGTVPTKVKCLEAETAIANGAREIDMVLSLGLLRSGELDVVKQDIDAVTAICHQHGAQLKVILEVATLDEEEVAMGCALAKLAGADFVKTSTGFHPTGGATVSHVALMRQVVGNDMGVKAAGGIRTAGDALAMIRAGANRIGSSAGVKMIQELAR